MGNTSTIDGNAKKGGMNKRLRNQIIMLVGLAVFIIIFEFITGGNLLKASNITSMSSSIIFLVISGYGMMFIFGTGIIDLSVGANILLSAAIGAFVGQLIGGVFGLIVFIIVSIVCAVILEQITVQCAVKLKIPAWIAGLGSGLILEALLNIWNTGAGLPNIASDYTLNFFGKSPGMYILVAICIVLAFIIYNKTTLGINLQAVGGNGKVASNMGINVKKTILLSTIIGAIFIGVAAVFDISNTGFVNPQLNLGSMSVIFRVLAVVMLADSLTRFFTQPIAIIYASAVIAIALNIFVLLTGKTSTELNFFLGILVVVSGILSYAGRKGVVK